MGLYISITQNSSLCLILESFWNYRFSFFFSNYGWFLLNMEGKFLNDSLFFLSINVITICFLLKNLKKKIVLYP